ncbi:rgs-3 [Pristionchus pacificus]|uniref:Rgs-3 n=1 Tax=Pristionchus pacificus TaxID=54126 RepID=A0A2A6CY52_PRIPA|nr:rgs-3 [Pristionchus pacificus]|eukprot:PDM82961.1 rgs-3 [Pristionchus pacificus]
MHNLTDGLAGGQQPDEEEELMSVSRQTSVRRRGTGNKYSIPTPVEQRTSRSGSGSSIGNRSVERLSPNPSVRSNRGSRSPSPVPVRVLNPAPSQPAVDLPSRPDTMVEQLNKDMQAMFDPSLRDARPEPEMPSADGVEYPRAAAWSAGQLQAVLSDDKGRQLFRVFLWKSLAEENLNFIEATEKLKKMKTSEDKKSFAQEIIDKYAVLINLSAPSMASIRRSAQSDDIDMEDWAPAIKEVRRLLENDQFPRFRRSDVYLDFLELILPRSYAEKWATSFEALLGNAVGRHHFRLFLRSIRAEENLRFWDAVVEFRASRGKTTSMIVQARDIIATFLTEGTPNEVFLPFGTKQVIDARVLDEQIDITLFDEATKHVEQVLRNDPYVRFLQSAEYDNLCAKLTRP